MNLVFLKRNRLWLKTFVWIFFAMFFSINGLIGQDIFDEKFEQIDGKLPTPNSYRTGPSLRIGRDLLRFFRNFGALVFSHRHCVCRTPWTHSTIELRSTLWIAIRCPTFG